MTPAKYLIKKFSRKPFSTSERLKEHYSNYYACFTSLNRLSLLDLQYLGNMAGLDMNFYKTKSMIIKGLIIRLSGGRVGVDDKFVELF